MSSLPSIQELLKKVAAEKNLTPASANPQPAEKAPAVTTPPTNPPVEDEVKVNDKSRIHLDTGETAHQFEEKMSKIITQEKEVESQKKAANIGLSSINLKGFPVSPDALSLVPEEQAKALKVICFLFTGPELRLGAVEPQNPAVQELLFTLGERNKTNAKLYLISEESLNQGLKLYAALPKIIPQVKGVQITESELEKYSAQMTDFSSIAAVLGRASITDLLAIVIAASLKLKSSDIHIEAEEKGIVVRFRVDGMLQEVAILDIDHWKRLINRIKLIAGLKINITDQAQDGRFTIFQKNDQIDVRISTIPTAFGESVVMRLLTPDTIGLDFEKLGFRPAALAKLSKEILRPNGMIITTGPTGSGKSTTLYAILNKLNSKDVKIITLEDPIEYKVEGINQSQIDYSKDYTFAKGLRSILRQDPDIVMVGEIRDLETAEIAIQAALTGHLLLSTIHTNDAAGAIPRFLSMGVKPHLLAPAINAILGQRLVRRLCDTCRQGITLDAETLTAVKQQLGSISKDAGEVISDVDKLQFYGPKGCSECNNTGYKGRVGVYEILIKDSQVEEAILKGSISEYQMREIAKQQGMTTMAQDGLLKAIDGLTAVEEVKRVVGF